MLCTRPSYARGRDRPVVGVAAGAPVSPGGKRSSSPGASIVGGRTERWRYSPLPGSGLESRRRLAAPGRRGLLPRREDCRGVARWSASAHCHSTRRRSRLVVSVRQVGPELRLHNAPGGRFGPPDEDRRACSIVGATPVWLPFNYGDYPRGADEKTMLAALRDAVAGSALVLVPGYPLSHADPGGWRGSASPTVSPRAGSGSMPSNPIRGGRRASRARSRNRSRIS